VQQTFEDALAEILGHPVHVTASGRTDAGVHAERQTVTLDTGAHIPAEGVRRRLDALLPDDLWVLQVVDVPRTFDARRSARRRWYQYAVWQGHHPDAGWRGRCLAHPESLDVGAMRRGAAALLGTQDRASLTGNAAQDERAGRSLERTVYAADWLTYAPEPLLLFQVCADAFVRQMVRAAVGSLLWVGEGRWTPERFAEALAARDRRAAGPTAPAEGLTLLHVEYAPTDTERLNSVAFQP
jgi:tRNA pseudouridine38-40 synthase